MNATADSSCLEAAGRLVDHEHQSTLGALSDESVLALAWAVKDLCYAAWSTEPRRAVRAASAMQQLVRAARSAQLTTAVPELEALAAWTDGIRHVIDGEMEAASATLKAARHAFERLGRPRHAAQTQVPRIMALAMLGRHDEAARCAEAARRVLVDQGDLLTASKVSLNLGNLHLRAHRHAAAAERFREAASLFSRTGDVEHSVMADIGLAEALASFGDFAEARRIIARAGSQAKAHGFPVLQALIDESSGLLDLVCGHYHRALSSLEAARRQYAELQMPQHLAIAEKQLADAYLALRLLPEALAGYEAALGRFAALNMGVDRAWTALQRGRALALAGQGGAATGALADAADAFATLDTPTGAAAVAMAQAELALAAGDAEGALARARAAAERFRSAGLLDRQLRAEAAEAQALLQHGDAAGAWQVFDATLTTAREHELLPVQLRCLNGRAMASRRLGNPSAAQQDLLAAVELFEEQRCLLPGDEMRSAFQSDHLQPFAQLMCLSLEAHERAEVGAADVLAQLDRLRARTLTDRLGPATSDGYDGAGGLFGPRTSAAAETADLRARLAWLYRRLRQQTEEGGIEPVLAETLRATERELLERTRRFRLAAGPGASATVAGTLQIAALQQALGPEDALVEYGVQDDELFACVATRETVLVRRHLAPWAQVIGTVRALRFQIESLRHGAQHLQRHMATLEARTQAHLQRLHAQVWQPLASALQGRTRVLVVPHAQLGSVPFAALHDGERYVVEGTQLACAPSARLAVHTLARRRTAARNVLALGGSRRLPHAAHEAKLVAGLLSRGQSFVGQAATIDALRAHASQADVLHFACHGQFRCDNPVFSALYLHDGPLTAEQVESLRLPGSLVVLSACDSALNDSDGGGDEMFGLTRAFLLAGASRVLAALWPVDDSTTADFMSDFYAGLRRDQPPAAALRLAQLAASRRGTHPFYWAPFVLTGGW